CCSCPTGLEGRESPALTDAARRSSGKNDLRSRLGGTILAVNARMAAINSPQRLPALPNRVSLSLRSRHWRRLESSRDPGRGRGKRMADDLNFTVQRPPAYGELTDVLPGLFWVRLPVPTAPNHVNCWLLDNGAGWTLVDCGLNTDDTFEMWDKLWRGLLRSRPLQNLAFTHAHTDHFCLGGYFVKEMKWAVRMPLTEWLSGWKMWHEREEGPDEQFASFLKRNGASDDDAARIMEAQRHQKFLGSRPPREFTRIRDGDVVAMGRREWRGITAGGGVGPARLVFFLGVTGSLSFVLVLSAP